MVLQLSGQKKISSSHPDSRCFKLPAIFGILTPLFIHASTADEKISLPLEVEKNSLHAEGIIEDIRKQLKRFRIWVCGSDEPGNKRDTLLTRIMKKLLGRGGFTLDDIYESRLEWLLSQSDEIKNRVYEILEIIAGNDKLFDKWIDPFTTKFRKGLEPDDRGTNDSIYRLIAIGYFKEAECIMKIVAPNHLWRGDIIPRILKGLYCRARSRKWGPNGTHELLLSEEDFVLAARILHRCERDSQMITKWWPLLKSLITTDPAFSYCKHPLLLFEKQLCKKAPNLSLMSEIEEI